MGPVIILIKVTFKHAPEILGLGHMEQVIMHAAEVFRLHGEACMCVATAENFL